jgi:hypothetical protein
LATAQLSTFLASLPDTLPLPHSGAYACAYVNTFKLTLACAYTRAYACAYISAHAGAYCTAFVTAHAIAFSLTDNVAFLVSIAAPFAAAYT